MRTYQTMSLSLPPKLVKAITSQAKREGKTKSEFIREALRQYLELKELRRAQAVFSERAREVGVTEEADVGAIDLFVCPFILEEFRRVAESKFRFSEEQIDFFENRILEAAKLADPSEKVAVIERHKKDDRILECAVEQGKTKPAA